MLIFKSNTWGSGEIRARQIAEYLKVPCDVRPEKGDVIVVVKSFVTDAKQALKHVKSIWIDVVDGYGLVDYLNDFPQMKAIAISRLAFDFIRFRTENEIVIIPEHHCNFDNVQRDADRDVHVVGAACYPGNFDLDIADVTRALASIGLEFQIKQEFPSRADVVKFYQEIDIQLCFRKFKGIGMHEPPELKNPLKLENAGSFMIPTVSYPEPNFISEFGTETFAPSWNLDEVVQQCKVLKDSKDAFQALAGFANEKAERFHISKIAPLYLDLQ